MNDRFNIRYFNKNTRKFEYYKIGTINTIPFTDCTVYEQGQFCTGLKDKNGKLIYEGDIVKQGDIKYVVNWLEGTFCFLELETSHNFTIEYVMPSKQKIIGNIYENKELLESEG